MTTAKEIVITAAKMTTTVTMAMTETTQRRFLRHNLAAWLAQKLQFRQSFLHVPKDLQNWPHCSTVSKYIRAMTGTSAWQQSPQTQAETVAVPPSRGPENCAVVF